MHLSGETEIAAARQRVWDSISHPESSVASGEAGQANVEKIDDTHYQITVVPTAAPIPMTVTLDIEITEATEPSRLAGALSGMVMGGPISGTGHVELTELGPKLTRMVWGADATLGGLLGGFEPMLAGPIQQGAEHSVESLKERLEAEEAATAS